jgi:hypothetical protein
VRTGTNYKASRIGMIVSQGNIWEQSTIKETWHIQSVTDGVAISLDDVESVLADLIVGTSNPIIPRLASLWTKAGGSGTTWQETCALASCDWQKAGAGLTVNLNYSTRYFYAQANAARGLARTQDNVLASSPITTSLLTLGCSMTPSFRTRPMKVYRINCTFPSPTVDRSSTDIGGTQSIAQVDVRQIAYKLKMYVDSETLSISELVKALNPYVGCRNSDMFYGCAPGTLIWDSLSISHLELDFWEVNAEFLYDEYSHHSQEVSLGPDGKPYMTTSGGTPKYLDVKWTREVRQDEAFNDFWPDGPFGENQKYQAWRGWWF